MKRCYLLVSTTPTLDRHPPWIESGCRVEEVNRKAVEEGVGTEAEATSPLSKTGKAVPTLIRPGDGLLKLITTNRSSPGPSTTLEVRSPPQ